MVKKDYSTLDRNEKIEYLQKLIAEQKSENDIMFPQITHHKEERYSYFPLSETQESFFVGKLMESEEHKVGCHIYCEIEENNLDVERLNRAWNKLVLHHDMLRDIITDRGQQKIEEEVIDYKFDVYDKRGAKDGELEEHLKMLRGRLSHKVYQAMDYPLYEICITKKKGEVFIIHFSIDEWIVDASSVAIILRQWYQLYRCEDFKPEPLSFTFRDFVIAQKKFENSRKYQEDLRYWKNKLFNINREEMDIVRPTKAVTGKLRKRYEYVLDRNRWDKLKKYAEQLNISPTALLLTIFLKVCKEYNAGKGFPLILTHFNRLPVAKDIDKVIGPFITTMIYQEESQPDKCEAEIEVHSEEFVRKAKQVQKQLWDDNDHNSISGIRILRELKKDKKVDKSYIIPIVFTSMINNVRNSNDENTGTWFDQITYSITQTPQVYLDHQIMEADGALIFNWDVLLGYFKDGVIEEMFSKYCDLLESSCGSNQVQLYIEKNSGEEREQEFELTDLQGSYLYSHLVNAASDKERLLYQEFLVKEDSEERINEKWQQLVREIDMLRTVFTKGGKQRLQKDVPVKEIPVIDLSGEEDCIKEAKLEKIREEIVNQGFSMFQWPMYDIKIIRLGEGILRVNIAFDTAIMDGQSLAILYKRLFDKEDSALTEQVTFHEYIKAKKSYEDNKENEAKHTYWNNKFKRHLIAPFSEYCHASGSGNNIKRISGQVAEYHKLIDLAKEHNVNIESILMAVYLEVLAGRCKEKEFTVVRVGWERMLTQPSIQNTIGEFTTLGWVARNNDRKTFWERVLDIDKQIRNDLDNKEVSGLSGLRKAKYSKSFPVVFTGLVKGEDYNLPDNVTRGYGLSKTPQVYLDNISFIEKNYLLVNWDFAMDIFPADLIMEMFEEYIKELNMLCRETKGSKQLVKYKNCIHQIVEEQVQKYPKNIAIKYKEEKLTYEELDRKANQLANYLRMQGVGKDDLVAICLEKSIDMIVAILAILKAGGAYVPIDPSYPRDRINYILEDSKTRIVIMKEEFTHKIETTLLHKLCLDTLHQVIEACSTVKPSEESMRDSLAYIIYTSGSTGKPKGVLITHHNVVRLFEKTQHWFGFNENDVFTMYHSYAFDFSVWEIWGALLYGGTLVVVPYEVSRSFSKVYELLEKEKVTVFSQTPTAFKQLMKIEEEEGIRNLNLRYIVFGGEALNLQSLKGWFKRHGDSKPQLINMYGITETTVHVTYRPIKEIDIHSSASLIGIPIPDLNLYILDENLKRVAAGETGEICVSGPGLARGYLNRPDITKEKFVDNPFSQGERLYLSGDLGRYLPNHDIEYMGRKDNQVKVRGFRIELGEIENVLLSHPQIKEAAVAIEKGEEDNKIRAFLVMEGEELSAKEIRHYVRSKLPDYMVPNIIDRIDHIPMTINGKLDYKKLLNNDNDVVIEKNSVKNDATREVRLSSLYRILQEELNEVSLNEAEDIFDLGATSLTIVNIAKRVQEELKILIPVDIFLDKPTIGEISDFVIELLDKREHENAVTSLPVNKIVLTSEELITIFNEELGEQEIASDADIFDLGVTSLTIVNVVKKIKERKGIEVPLDVFLDHPTVNEIIRYILNENLIDRREEKQADHPDMSIELLDVHYDEEAYLRQEEKYRFENKQIASKDFSGLLSLLKKETVGIKSRYLYASAGGKNAVQTYLYIKDKAVEGIPAGVYYYHPEEHQLYFLTPGSKVIRDIYSSCYREAFDQSAFAVFFIAQLRAIEPVYLDFSKGLVTIDTGYMQELLLSKQEAYQVGLCCVEEIYFSQVREDFLLDSGHVLINGMLGGYRARNSYDKINLHNYLSERNESLTSHCRSVERIIDENEMREINRQMKYNQLTKREVLELAKQKLHLRKFEDGSTKIALTDAGFDKNRYLMRSSKREYKKEKISFNKFSEFLSVLRGKTIMGTVKFMYPSLFDGYLLKVYVHVKMNAVEQLEEGLYQYDRLAHKLILISRELETVIGHCHTPFNRPHYKASAFSIFLLADLREAERIYGEGALKYILTESGYMGQLLMEHQAKSNIGIVPIGGMNFDKISESFHLKNKDMLIHSFMGGLYDYNAMTVQEEAVPQMSEASMNDIAIIGLSARFPDAADLSEYWENLKNKKRSITKLPQRRKELWNGNDLQEDEYYCGYIQDIELFDYELFHMSLLEAKNIDPQERIMLQMVYECIEGAGYTIEGLQENENKVGVFIGSMWNDYEDYGVETYRNTKEADIASLPSSIANRISYYFNFSGPSLAIQTACSSSMTALHIACESIKSGECDMAVVGGINLISHPYHLEALKSQNIIAVNGEVKLFSDQSTGLICGEGAGVVLLTKLSKAIEQEDLIWATIKNTAIANYGKTTRYGMVSLPKQKKLISELLKKAGISPNSIQYIEASATGLAIADVTEVQALTDLFTESGLSEKSCLIGSVKANIGHLESASFLSQLCKVVLQMQQEEVVPTILDTEINPLIHLERTPFQFADRLQKWTEIQKAVVSPYRALINSFGASGSIGSAIVEQYKSAVCNRAENKRDTVILISDASIDQLNEYIKKVVNYLKRYPQTDIRDIAYTLSHRNNTYSDRAVFICSNTEELIHLASEYLEGDASDPRIVLKDTWGSLMDGAMTNLQKAAFNWVSRTDESSLSEWIKKANKIYLPVRPFKRLICWNSKMNAAIGKNEKISEGNNLVKEIDGSKSETEELVKYLVEIYANISEIPVNKIDSRTPLENYGLSSIIISKFNKVLEHQLSVKSSTLLFEVQTLQELAELLLIDYREEIMNSNKSELLRWNYVRALLADTAESNDIKKHEEQMTVEQNSRDIAIIGLSGIYPEADNLEELWDNLMQGKDSITEIPLERWNHKAYFDSDNKKNIYAKWGGFLRNMDGFDPLFFQISPKEAMFMDPQERKFLEVAYQTLEDAGYTKKSILEKYQGKVGVYVGAMFHDYQMFSGKSVTEGSYIATGAVGASISNRISYFLDLHGPSMTVNTMCSSVLACLNLAVQSIHSGECKAAIVGGVNLIVHPNKYVLHCQNRMLSTDGRCRAFGKDGDGFVPSEGVGAILIKPLAEAIHDKDHIYGIIKGIKINHDGKKNGYMVPSPVQQGNLIKSVLQENNISPESISYIEAHGTGTKLGDPIEIAGLSHAYKDVDGKKKISSIGSIKSNIGHCESAAGMASITKVLLQMKHKMLVPSIHCDDLNPNIDFDHSPFYVQNELAPWEVGQNQLPRRASVSSFGAGGVNGYLVLEEYERREKSSTSDYSRQLLVMSAHTAIELKENVKRILHYLTQIFKGTHLDIMDIKKIISEILHIDSSNIDISEKLTDLGLSKEQLELLIAQIESKYAVKIENVIIVQNETIEELIESIKEKLEALYKSPVHERQEYTLQNIAHTLLHGREHMEERIAVIATTPEELIETLKEYLTNPSTDKVMSGNMENACKVKEEYEVFLEQLANPCLTEDTMKDFAGFYVKGAEIDWKSVTDTNGAYKVSLPTYPFTEKKYWVPVNIEGSEYIMNSAHEAVELISMEALVDPVTAKEEFQTANDSDYSKYQISDEALEQSISAIIRNILAHILEMDEQEINLNYELQKYGVDSIMLSDLSVHINKVYGIHTTAAMLLSFHTIKDLIKGLHKKYSKEISCYEMRSKKVTDTVQKKADETEVTVTKVSVTKGKVEEAQRMEHNDSEPIAVIGIAGMAPGAENILQYWDNLLNNQCSITECKVDRRELYEYLRANNGYEDIMNAGYLNDIDKWEPLFFGISPNEAKRMDPQQRLFLEVTQRALEDAGYSRKRISGTKTGVFVGVSNDDYSKIIADYSIRDAHSAIGVARSLIANRVSYYFNVNGPSEVIDTACSSSGVAINNAIKSLRNKECSMSIVGGVNLLLTPDQFISYDDAGMLTKNRKVSVFSDTSNGYLRGEGVGCVILKPLSKAIKENDRIHALILGSAVNHGGKAMSITTPNYEAQMEVMKEACRDSKISEKTVTYIEAQGSANKIGDSIEWQALEEAYGETLDGLKRGVGTIKANIGHLESASGIFALIKVIFAMKHKIIPAMIHCDRISDDIYCYHNTLVRENIKWDVLIDKDGNLLPRRAGINAYGIGGVNAHFIVEEYMKEDTQITGEDEESLITLSANSKDVLKEYIKRVKIYASRYKDTKLVNFAYTLQMVREDMPYRLAFVADNWETVIQKCNLALEETQQIHNCSMDNTNSLLEQILEPSGIDIIVREAIKARNLGKIGILWSRGIDINWTLLYEGKSLQITDIPEYPYEKESFWISDLSTKKSMDVETVESSDQIINMLMKEIAKITGTDSCKLADNVALIQYGFDSIMFAKLKYYIETQFMINVGSNEILYRNTIGEIAAVIRKKTSGVIEDTTELQHYQGEDLDDLFERLTS